MCSLFVCITIYHSIKPIIQNVKHKILSFVSIAAAGGYPRRTSLVTVERFARRTTKHTDTQLTNACGFVTPNKSDLLKTWWIICVANLATESLTKWNFSLEFRNVCSSLCDCRIVTSRREEDRENEMSKLRYRLTGRLQWQKRVLRSFRLHDTHAQSQRASERGREEEQQKVNFYNLSHFTTFCCFFLFFISTSTVWPRDD